MDPRLHEIRPAIRVQSSQECQLLAHPAPTLEQPDGDQIERRHRYQHEADRHTDADIRDTENPVANAQRVIPFEAVGARPVADSRIDDDAVARMEALDCPVDTLPNAGHFVHVDAPDELLRWLLRG